MITEVVRVRSTDNSFCFVIENPKWTTDNKVSGSAMYIQYCDGEWRGPIHSYIDLKKMESYSVEYVDVKTWEQFCQENFTVGAN